MRIRDCSSDVCSADLPQAVPAKRLQMVAEDTWYAAEAGKDAAAKRSESHEREQRQKAALLIKQQRQRITNLELLRKEDALKLTAAAEKEREALQEETRTLQQKLQQQNELNASLQHRQSTRLHYRHNCPPRKPSNAGKN